MTTENAVILARKHASLTPGGSSARVCLADAVALKDEGKLEDAKKRAVDSLRYSVGVFHPDYKRAAK